MNASASLRIAFFACGLALLLSSCGQDDLRVDREMEAACWSRTDTLDLTFTPEDTQQVYQLVFPVTFTDAYPYSNIYLRAIVESPSGARNVLPTQFVLQDRTGAWLSEPSGGEIPFELGLEDALRFNQAGAYRIRLYQYMRDEPLCGVVRAGIAMRKPEE